MVAWSHSQKHFFKYVTMRTARSVLKYGTLRWSAPSNFNDPFDIQFDMHVDYQERALINDVVNELWLIYSLKKAFEPKNRLGYFVREMSVSTPGLKEFEFKATVRKGVMESLAAQKIALPKLQACTALPRSSP